MADQNSLERCLASLEKTLRSRTGLPLLKRYIDEKYSGSELENHMLIVEFLETCLVILSDKLSDVEKFRDAKQIAEVEDNRVRQKIKANANQLRIMQTSSDINELEATVKAVFDRNTAEDTSLHQVFVAFRDEELAQRSFCGLPKKEKKRNSCELS